MIGKEKKPDLIFIVLYLFLFLFGLLLTIHVTNEYYNLQAVTKEQLNILNYPEILENALNKLESSPFDIRLDNEALKLSGVYIFCVVIGVAYVKTSKKNIMGARTRFS